mmetsp:Transcript_21067/g.66225  ORF Transcript_21067/g.66225 Transcript_21067/m.66225 type:complete len:559 (+) Transcript_21067:97-1773(+)
MTATMRRRSVPREMDGLPPQFEREEDEGNCEYKLSLATASAERVRHLVTQLLFRLNEGGGRALYRVGVRDDGRAEGLCERELRASLATLRAMTRTLGARVAECRVSRGTKGLVAEVRVEACCQSESRDEASFAAWLDEEVRRDEVDEVEASGELAKVKRREVSEAAPRPRVCVIGAVSAGKSTLIGVLATGALDDGRGSARAAVLRHGHEVAAEGTTSAIAEVAARDCVLVDLAGREKYLKTTIFGLTARSPDAALLVVDARDAALRRMTAEHLGVALALKLTVVVALTHADAVSPRERRRAVERVGDVLARSGAADASVRVVSSTTGEGVDALRAALAALPRRRLPPEDHPRDATRVRLHGARRVSPAGVVLFGHVDDGVARAGDVLLLGPVGGWRPVTIRSIRLSPDETPVASAARGRSASFAVGDDCDDLLDLSNRGARFFFKSPDSKTLRRPPCGMVLLHPDRPRPEPTLAFDALLLLLRPPNTKGLHPRYQTVVHAHAVKQAATITHVHHGPLLTPGTKARCSLAFLYHPELLLPGTIIILRDSRTRAVGTVL